MNKLIFTVFFLLISNLSTANVFYVDPVLGLVDGDGSESRPWKSLQKLFDGDYIDSYKWSIPYSDSSYLIRRGIEAPIRGGDRIVLKDGYYGSLKIRGFTNRFPITIISENRHGARFSNIDISASSNWIVDGVSISSTVSDGAVRGLFLVEDHRFHGPSNNITLKSSKLFSIQDSSTWTAADWRNEAISGVVSYSDYTKILNNHVFNIKRGVLLAGDYSTVKSNRISFFSRDGIQTIGDFNDFISNYVSDSIKVDGNHADLFQSWSVGKGGKVGSGTVYNNRVIGNYFIAQTDLNSPLSGYVQGIGCFDGFYENWVVENNLIVVSNWNGIAFYGLNNSRVSNNTVVDVWNDTVGPAQIRIFPHKNSLAGKGNELYNNFSYKLVILPDSGVVASGNNINQFSLSSHFKDPLVFDFSLKSSSSAINNGSSSSSVRIDILGNSRDESIDVGAYEYIVD
ncbi:choice-of-anchor Q domain-containing protein [Amphritea sp. HPY]|uniref:choice-of-anchor Q domain-containing protein n=1 Tax=Amphritea sp. HPY TaxID=3421652 RepID=UPI003D7E2405